MQLVVTDIDPAKVKRVVSEFGRRGRWRPRRSTTSQADIFAPCALGATINDETIPRLKVEIIAGGANNQLLEERHGDVLQKRGLHYAPDYVINGGGVINVYGELPRWPHARSARRRARSTRRCSGSSRSRSASGFRRIAPRTAWPSSGSRPSAASTGRGWGSGRGDGRVTEPIASLLRPLTSRRPPDPFRPRRPLPNAWILIH